jgi:hypothetical protein
MLSQAFARETKRSLKDVRSSGQVGAVCIHAQKIIPQPAIALFVNQDVFIRMARYDKIEWFSLA